MPDCVSVLDHTMRKQTHRQGLPVGRTRLLASSDRSAFTLLEIMLVVTIIALLLGTAIYKLAGNVEYARHTRVQADVQGIGTQLKLYESMNGFYPTTEQGLQSLVTQPDTDAPPGRWYHLYKEEPKDPWK